VAGRPTRLLKNLPFFLRDPLPEQLEQEKKIKGATGLPGCTRK